MPLITMLKKMTKGNNNIGKTVEAHTSDVQTQRQQKGNTNDEQNDEENNNGVVAISPSMPSSLYSRRRSGDEESALSSCEELSVCRSISTTSESDLIRDIEQDLGKNVMVEEEEKSNKNNNEKEVLFQKNVDEMNILENEQKNAALYDTNPELTSTTSNADQPQLTCVDDSMDGAPLSHQKVISNFDDNDENDKNNNKNSATTENGEEINTLNFSRRSDLSPLIRNTSNTTAPLTQFEAEYPIDPQHLCDMFFKDQVQGQELIGAAAHEMFLHTYYQFYGPEQRPTTRGAKVTCFTPCDSQRDVLVNDTWRDSSYYTSDDVCFCNRCVYMEISNHVARGGVLPLSPDATIPEYLPALTNHCRSAKNRRILQPIAELPEKEEIALRTQIDREEDIQQAPDAALAEYMAAITACCEEDLDTVRTLHYTWLSRIPSAQRILYELYISRFNHGHLDAFHVDNIIYPFGYDWKNQVEVDVGRCTAEWQVKMIKKHQGVFKQTMADYHARGNALQQQVSMLLNRHHHQRKNGKSNMKEDALKLSQLQLQITQWSNNVPVASNLGLHFMANWQVATARPNWIRGSSNKMSGPQHRILQRFCPAKEKK